MHIGYPCDRYSKEGWKEQIRKRCRLELGVFVGGQEVGVGDRGYIPERTCLPTVLAFHTHHHLVPIPLLQYTLLLKPTIRISSIPHNRCSEVLIVWFPDRRREENIGDDTQRNTSPDSNARSPSGSPAMQLLRPLFTQLTCYFQKPCSLASAIVDPISCLCGISSDPRSGYS